VCQKNKRTKKLWNEIKSMTKHTIKIFISTLTAQQRRNFPLLKLNHYQITLAWLSYACPMYGNTKGTMIEGMEFITMHKPNHAPYQHLTSLQRSLSYSNIQLWLMK
jgi:hypothetical protein